MPMKPEDIVVGGVYEGGKSGARRVHKIQGIVGQKVVYWQRVSTGHPGYSEMKLFTRWAKRRIDAPSETEVRK